MTIVKTELTSAQWALLDAIWLQVLAETQGVHVEKSSEVTVR